VGERRRGEPFGDKVAPAKATSVTLKENGREEDRGKRSYIEVEEEGMSWKVG